MSFVEKIARALLLNTSSRIKLPKFKFVFPPNDLSRISLDASNGRSRRQETKVRQQRCFLLMSDGVQLTSFTGAFVSFAKEIEDCTDASAKDMPTTMVSCQTTKLTIPLSLAK